MSTEQRPVELPDLVTDLNAVTESHRKVSPRRMNWASEAGWVDDCLRRLVLVRTEHAALEPPPFQLQSIFDQGHLQHSLLKHELWDAGWELVESERAETWDKFELTGRIDGKVVRQGQSRPRFPIELKSSSPQIFASLTRCKTVEDLLDQRLIWIRHYPAQLMLYLLLMNQDAGILLVKDKSSGLKHQINAYLSYSYAEHILKSLEEVNQRVAAREPPPAVRVEACGRCEFQNSVCFTGKDYGPGFEILQDPELEAKLNRWWILKKPAKEWMNTDEELKDLFRRRNAQAGDYLITSKIGKTTVHKIPAEVKAPYASEEERVQVTITRLVDTEIEEG